MPLSRTFAILCLAVVVLAGCGRRGAPRPPQWVVPRPPTDLAVKNVEGGLEVSFRRPDRTIDGADMSDLGTLELWRSCEPRPGMFLAAEIPILDRGTFRKRTRYTLMDDTPGIGATCVYRVIAVTDDGYRSAPVQSEPVRREPVLPADATNTPRD